MDSNELRNRTMRFAIEVIRYLQTLKGGSEVWVIRKQLTRSVTSIAANHRAAGRARSRPEFLAKLCIVVEETDESVFWLEFIREADLDTSEQLRNLLREGRELLYIFSASRKTTKENLKKKT